MTHTRYRFLPLIFLGLAGCYTVEPMEAKGGASGMPVADSETPEVDGGTPGGEADPEGETDGSPGGPEREPIVIDRSALQPYRVIEADPAAYFVPQGPSECGPTAFYTVLKYLGDHRRPCPYFYQGKGCDKCLDLDEEIPGDAGPELTEETKVGAWFDVGFFGEDCDILKEKILEDIYFISNNGVCMPFFAPVDPVAEKESCDTLGMHPLVSDHRDNEEKRYRLDYITKYYLTRNLPVILHLSRIGFLESGHYVVLTGYDPDLGEVHLLDPNQEAPADAVLVISHGAFILSKAWSGDIDAYWDGSWIGFDPAD